MKNYLTIKWIARQIQEKLQIKQSVEAAEQYISGTTQINRVITPATTKEARQGYMKIARESKGPNQENVSLTPQQEKFLEDYLANGNDAGMAYQSAYQVHMGRLQASKKGEETLRRPNVARELDARINRAKKAENIEKAAIVKDLKYLLKLSKETGDTKTILRCIEMLTRIGGFFPSTSQTNIQTNINSSDRNIDVKFGSFDTTSSDAPIEEEIQDIDFTEEDDEPIDDIE